MLRANSWATKETILAESYPLHSWSCIGNCWFPFNYLLDPPLSALNELRAIARRHTILRGWRFASKMLGVGGGRGEKDTSSKSKFQKAKKKHTILVGEGTMLHGCIGRTELLKHLFLAAPWSCLSSLSCRNYVRAWVSFCLWANFLGILSRCQKLSFHCRSVGVGGTALARVRCFPVHWITAGCFPS